MKQVVWVAWEGRRDSRLEQRENLLWYGGSSPQNGAQIPDVGQTLRHGWHPG